MTDRYRAFMKLLDLPDPADLPHRGHVWTQPGDPQRMERRMPALMMRWLQYRLLAQTEDVPSRAKKAKRTRRPKAILRMRASA